MTVGMPLVLLIFVVKYIVLFAGLLLIVFNYRNRKGKEEIFKNIDRLILRFSILIVFTEALHVIFSRIVNVPYRLDFELLMVVLANPFIVVFLLILGLIHAMMLILFCNRFIYKFGCFGLISQWFLSFIFISNVEIKKNCHLAKVINIINIIGKFLLLIGLFVMELTLIKLTIVIIIRLLL